MGSVNTNINGVDFTITKQPDGSFTYSTESMPGASFGPNNEAVAGHYGGPLTADSVSNSINSLRDLISTKQSYIDNANQQLNSSTIDPDYAAMLKNNVAKASADIEEFKSQAGVLIAIQGQIGNLQAQAEAADNAGENPEAKTGAQANADAAQGSTDATGATSTQEDPTQPYTGGTDVTNAGVVNNSDSSPNNDSSNDGGVITRSIFPKGGVSASASSAGVEAKWSDATDVRAILRVPSSYLSNITDPAGVLQPFGGIVFPYTPTISFSHDVTYASVNPTHSNYTQYFYKNSAVSAISVSAKFTVQNENDAAILVGVITLLRALTKMKFGPDPDAGAPPPVCRFNAYGNFMLSNVPVTVASFKHDLPDGVDYFQTDIHRPHGLNFVPMMSVITLTLNPTYSRAEMQRVGVNGAIAGRTQRAGFL